MKNAKGAVVGKAGAAWPYRMVTEIYEALLTKYHGRYILKANTQALAIYQDTPPEHPYSVMTPRGIIHAKHVVHCTEGHAAYLLPTLRSILVPRRGQISVQNPGIGLPQHGTYSWKEQVV